MDEDAIERAQDKLLNDYLDGTNDELSNCCEAFFIEDSDICSDCLEHAVTMTEAYENYQCDKADSERELKREQDD